MSNPTPIGPLAAALLLGGCAPEAESVLERTAAATPPARVTIAPTAEALTFARVDRRVLGVTRYEDGRVDGVDLGDRHVATGLNFPAHAGESGAGEQPFLFPKLTRPTGPRAPVAVAGRLLDYEVEVAWIPLSPLAEGDRPASMGLVLCNDYTD